MKKGPSITRKKLTAANVKQIVKATQFHTQEWVAEKFGIQQPMISDILSGRRWSKVTGRKYKPVHRKAKAKAAKKAKPAKKSAKAKQPAKAALKRAA